MKVRLLGTGASDGMPALFGDSRVNRYAREHGGRDTRLRAAALIDDGLKIDLGPDTHAQVVRYGIDPLDWTAIVITHSHDDHFARNELQYALIPFTDREYPTFTIYGNETTVTKVFERYPDWPFECVTLRSFETVRHLNYWITTIKANHTLEEDCLNLIVDDGQGKLLYASDTGVWCEETWEFLAGRHVDAMVIECTDGLMPTSYQGHLGVQSCREVVQRLRDMGVLSANAPIVTTHHSHQGGATHAQLEAALAGSGIGVGYDGICFPVKSPGALDR